MGQLGSGYEPHGLGDGDGLGDALGDGSIVGEGSVVGVEVAVGLGDGSIVGVGQFSSGGQAVARAVAVDCNNPLRAS